jgi:hypothetical protein
MKVICISAKARHGKDQSAEFLKEIFEAQGKKVLITHYADLVKYVCKTFFNWNGEKDDYGRTLLQTVGTDIVGAQQKDFWVNFIINILKFFPNEWDIVLIPDCRYAIEYELIKDNFDTALLRIERPGFDNGLSTAQKAHASETALDNYKFDTIIYNSGSLEELKDKLTEYANTL